MRVLMCVCVAGGAVTSNFARAGWFASSVVSYDQGIGAVAGYTDPSAALGSPTRTTGFDLRVTPFNPPFQSSEIVSIGRGGHLVVAFDSPITNDAGNPFGIDMLVFGNSFFYNDDFEPIADHIWKPGGTVEVSADGISWSLITGAVADGVFPTMGFTDGTDPFGADSASIETNFRVPVDPSFDPWGKNYGQLKAGYGVSGGGSPVDLEGQATGIRFVRISNPIDAPYAIEIDAISDVIPAPASLIPASGLLVVVGGRWRR